MVETTIRLLVLVLASIATWLVVWSGRRYVETQRRRALAAAPIGIITTSGSAARGMPDEQVVNSSSVRILAFSSADCHQCHQLQAPALQRVLEARGERVSVLEVDATAEHELVQTYHVLTVPSTVVLDASGNAHAVNYGFANTQRLLAQVDGAMAK